MASVTSIVYKPMNESAPDHGYLREPLQEARLIAGYGIENDRKGGHPQRALNLMDADDLESLAAEGYPSGPGALGENITVRGIDLVSLSPGMHLQLGDEAVIGLVKLRTGCHKLHQLDARMPDGVADRIGWMCQVVRSGSVRVGDPVTVLTAPQEKPSEVDAAKS